MKILRRDVNVSGQLVREHVLAVEVSSPADAETYLRQQIPRGYATHGFDSVNSAWWGRHKNAQDTSWFFIQP